VNKDYQTKATTLDHCSTGKIYRNNVRICYAGRPQLKYVARKYNVMAALPNIGVEKRRRAILSNYKADLHET